MNGLILLLMAAMLAGCSAQATLQQITVADAARAVDIATAADDPDGVACATAIGAWVASQPSLSSLAPAGALSTYMLAREAHRQVQGGVPSAIHRACAVLLIDAERLAIQLGLKFAPVPGL